MKIRICASTNIVQSKCETDWFEVPDDITEEELQNIALEEALGNGLCEIWWEIEGKQFKYFQINKIKRIKNEKTRKIKEFYM